MAISGLGTYGAFDYQPAPAKKNAAGKGEGSGEEKEKTGVFAADLLKKLEESHKLSVQKSQEKDDDWRSMSDKEWDEMIEGIDEYLDTARERLKEMKKVQDEAATKAALEADPGMKTIAAASAALSVAANGFSGVMSTESAETEEPESVADDAVYINYNSTQRFIWNRE